MQSRGFKSRCCYRKKEKQLKDLSLPNEMFFLFQITDIKMEYECECFVPPPLRRQRRLIVLGTKKEKELAKMIQSAIEADETQKVKSETQVENINVNKCNKTNK